MQRSLISFLFNLLIRALLIRLSLRLYVRFKAVEFERSQFSLLKLLLGEHWLTIVTLHRKNKRLDRPCYICLRVNLICEFILLNFYTGRAYQLLSFQYVRALGGLTQTTLMVNQILSKATQINFQSTRREFVSTGSRLTG